MGECVGGCCSGGSCIAPGRGDVAEDNLLNGMKETRAVWVGAGVEGNMSHISCARKQFHPLPGAAEFFYYYFFFCCSETLEHTLPV